jgi:hypothetical protein
MAYNKRTWTDRTVERPLTFIMQDNGDGTTTLIPSEGSIITTGTPITADNLNNIENGIADHDTRIVSAEGRLTTNEGNISGLSTRMGTAEADIGSAEGRLSTNEGNISGLSTRMGAAETELGKRPRMYAEQSDGAFIMQRASNAIYGKLSPNANFLVSVTDTAYSTRYLVFSVHWQYQEILSIDIIAQATLGVVQNTIGTISITGNAGQPYFTFIGIT